MCIDMQRDEAKYLLFSTFLLGLILEGGGGHRLIYVTYRIQQGGHASPQSDEASI